jgi:putative OPT family oligopeptide transporter
MTGADRNGERASPLVPYVPNDSAIAEFTLRAVVLGTVLSVAFGMVNAYLGLRIGLTVSASIPSAVLSMAVLRGVLRRGTVLENNVVQTIASAGESLAAGVVFTVPALLFIGLDPSGFRIFLLAATAGLLGVLMMIPVRHTLTVAEHGRLPFPEGTACAKVLIAGDRGATEARPVFLGLFLGGVYQFAVRALHLWRETLFFSSSTLHKMSFGAELTPLFLGVGYLVGLRIAAIMLGGGLLAWVVLIPLFDLLGGSGLGRFLGVSPDVAQMDAWRIWQTHVRFVGAGAVACGGAASILRALPEMTRSVRAAFARPYDSNAHESRSRIEKDLPLPFVFAAVIVLFLAIWLIPGFEMGFAQTILAAVFSYFFVIVSARMVGLIGNTSQPISGMTITALLGTAFVLHLLGYEGQSGMAAALSVAAIVCVATAVAGDVSQDLKCGALVGATPRSLQLGEMIGAVTSAVRIGWVLFLLNEAYTIGSELLPAPQAKLMATLAEGVMHGNLPWSLLLLGVGLAGIAELMRVPSLPFAVGLYLPITTTGSLIAGGLIAHWHQRKGRDQEPATLLASGLIAGDALVGILIAGLVVSGWDRFFAVRTPGEGTAVETVLTFLPFLAMMGLLVRVGYRRARGI